ncbi:MAG: class I SAM-dependent methyltransferase [Balneolaceae bacterium]|nr:class I SAM-dependent methyltransferase [Balneolaceae bacterium]
MKPALQRRVQRYGWDKASAVYEDSWKTQLKPAQNKLLEMADLKPGETALETACGTGLVTFRIAEAVGPSGEIVATDLSEEMINLAQKTSEERGIENVTYKRMDAEKLDLEDNRFDVAINALGLMYIPDPVQSLKEMHRVLKPHGQALIAIWGERKNCGWAEIFPIVDKRVESDVCPLFFQQGTGNTIEISMSEAGFKEIKTERFSADLYYPSDELALSAAFAGGPVALAYKKFDKKTREEAHQEYLDSIAVYKSDKGYNIPGEFVVAAGVK